MIATPRKPSISPFSPTDREERLQIDELRRMTLGEYHRLIEIGFFTPDDKVELLDGYLVRKMPQDDPHAVLVDVLPEVLKSILPAKWTVRAQLPVTLVGDSEPEPDAVVCLGPKKRYFAGHPTAKDIPIVIEVADSTIRRDRTIKMGIYARNRIPFYWIVNIPGRIVEVYSKPLVGRSPRYRVRTDFPVGSKIPVIISDETLAEFSVDEILV